VRDESRPEGWVGHVLAGALIGVLAGFAWPTVYVIGQMLAEKVGWPVGDYVIDPEEGIGGPVERAIFVIAFLTGLFLLLNFAVGWWARIPMRTWLPVGIAVALVGGILTGPHSPML
jgi:flagellar biosynthesis protein FliR